MPVCLFGGCREFLSEERYNLHDIIHLNSLSLLKQDNS